MNLSTSITEIKAGGEMGSIFYSGCKFFSYFALYILRFCENFLQVK
jgi:hypothetical protein